MSKKKAIEKLKELDTLLTERISEIDEVKGYQQHTYVYYRRFVFKAIKELGGWQERPKPQIGFTSKLSKYEQR